MWKLELEPQKIEKGKKTNIFANKYMVKKLFKILKI